MNRRFVNLLSAMILIFAMCVLLGIRGAATGVMTPYAQASDPDTFWNGATFVLQRTEDTETWITLELERMKERYNINTITVYGLESIDDAGSDEYKAYLFSELKRLDMRAVVRIESYDAKTFSFSEEDARKVMDAHRSLVDFVSRPENREQVAYFALNMPVDDGVVQANLGGVNSETSKENQVRYAKELVRLMREETTANQFENAKMFLSIFYGWDNTYEIPSYASAGADGYFINNYSYPDGRIPTEDDDGDTLINAARLRVSMEHYVSQYGDMPLVIECGFHTMEYNGGQATNQAAGLVSSRAAKQKALLAMADFYHINYPQVRGILYFGYNLYKEEGNPPVVMDWSLQYPTRDIVPAEDTVMSDGAEIVSDDKANGGSAAAMTKSGCSLTLAQCPPVQQLQIRYRADKDTKVGLYVQNDYKKSVILPASKEYTDLAFLLTVVEDYNLTIRAEDNGGLFLDEVLLLENMEAECAVRGDGAEIHKDESCSNGTYVTGLESPENCLVYEGSRGGEYLTVTYRAEKDTKLTMVCSERQFEVDLPATEAFTSTRIMAKLAPGASFQLYSDNPALALDCVQLTGAPAPNGVGAVKEIVPDELQDSGTARNSKVWICAAAFAVVIISTLLALRALKRRNKESRCNEK